MEDQLASALREICGKCAAYHERWLREHRTAVRAQAVKRIVERHPELLIAQFVNDVKHELPQPGRASLESTQVRALKARRQTRFTPLAWAVGGAAVAATVLLSFSLLRKGSEQAPTNTPAPMLAFSTEHQGVEAAGTIAEPIRSKRAGKVLKFSDGSKLTLGPDSALKVAALRRDGATLVVDRGAADVYVVPRKPSSWHFAFGPFKVQVLGTRFRANWDADAKRFQLDLVEGKLTVEGPSLGRRELRAGQHVDVNLSQPVIAEPFDGGTDDAPKTSTTTADGSTIATASPKRRRVRRPRSKKRPVVVAKQPKQPAPDPLDGLAALARRNPSAALAKARALGIAVVSGKANATTLAIIAAQARAAGNWKLAVRLYRTIRKRFGGSIAASRAAFALGRIAFDHHKNFRQAAAHFATFLRERPNDAMAALAAGRRLDALNRLGRRPCKEAKALIKRYPTHPYAALARRIESLCE